MSMILNMVKLSLCLVVFNRFRGNHFWRFSLKLSHKDLISGSDVWFMTCLSCIDDIEAIESIETLRAPDRADKLDQIWCCFCATQNKSYAFLFSPHFHFAKIEADMHENKVMVIKIRNGLNCCSKCQIKTEECIHFWNVHLIHTDFFGGWSSG